MAAGAAYPAEIVDANGNVTEGVTLQFTDSTDQPSDGTSVGGVTVTGTPSAGQVLTATATDAADWEDPAGPPAGVIVAFDFNNPLLEAQQVANNLGPGTVGVANSTCTGPPTVYAMGTIITGAAILLTTSGVIASTADALDYTLNAYVTNQAGTQQAHCSVTSSLPSPVTDTAHTLDLSGGTWVIDTGADLSDGGSGDLVSAAGGVYTTTVVIQVAWD